MIDTYYNTEAILEQNNDLSSLVLNSYINALSGKALLFYEMNESNLELFVTLWEIR